MDIKSGIGIGEAQVYDISSLENNYYKLLQQQAKGKAKFQEELVDLISKVKTDGARDIDKPLIAKGYEEIKDLYRRASSVRNTTERNLIRSQLTSGIQSLNEAAARSADEAKSYKDTLKGVANIGDYMYDSNKLNEFKSRINKPITELSVYDPLELQKIPDDSSRDRAFDNIYTELKPKAQYGPSRTLSGGRKQEVGIVNPVTLASNIMERLNSNPEWKNLATRTYMQQNPDKQPEFKDIVENEVKLYMARRGNEYVGEPTRPSTGGSDAKEQQAAYNRKSLLDKLLKTVPGSDREFLEISSLPYGTQAKFADLKRNGKVFRRIFKVVVPKSGWDSAVAANPLLAEYGFGKDDVANKTKVFEFDVNSPDARRGLNVFIDQFSGGKNVPYKNVKRNNPPTAPKTNVKTFDVDAYLKKKGIK